VLAAGAALMLGCLPAAAQPYSPHLQACHSTNIDEKIAGCTRFIARGPGESARDRANAYSNRAYGYARKRQYGLAIRDYEMAIRIDPKDSVPYSAIGNLYVEMGDDNRALAAFSRELAHFPRDSAGYYLRALVYFRLGDDDSAIRDFSQAIRLMPFPYQAAYVGRSKARQRKGDLAGAYEDATTAVAQKNGPFDAQARAQQDNVRRAIANLAVAKKAQVAAPPPQVAKTTALPASTPTNEKRVALVIGNGTYATVPVLRNPPNDARAVATALRQAGFTSVQLELDLNRDKLLDALKKFAAEVEGADWAVLYFAGHGIEVSGTNWLIPVDAALKTDRDVEFEAVSLDRIMTTVESVKKLGIVILDACRDNPFAAKMRRTIGRRSIGRGLASIEPRRGTLVAYAAKHGETALDGKGANSPFASALVKRLRTPGLEVNKLFRLVRDDVLAATNNEQEPYVYGTLPAQDFFFKK
jgi:tetratricopeptide (TPR) repeat protein